MVDSLIQASLLSVLIKILIISGIGFKSVFLITAQPYIFSNGYQIRFNEGPCPHCNVGYIVPEWVETNPTLSVIESIHGNGTPLPTQQ